VSDKRLEEIRKRHAQQLFTESRWRDIDYLISLLDQHYRPERYSQPPTFVSRKAAAKEIAQRWFEGNLPMKARLHSLKLLQLETLAEEVIAKHGLTLPAVPAAEQDGTEPTGEK
jgi:hypothetical protein